MRARISISLVLRADRSHDLLDTTIARAMIAEKGRLYAM